MTETIKPGDRVTLNCSTTKKQGVHPKVRLALEGGAMVRRKVGGDRWIIRYAFRWPGMNKKRKKTGTMIVPEKYLKKIQGG